MTPPLQIRIDMEENKLEMLQNMDKQDAEIAHAERHKKRQTKKAEPKEKKKVRMVTATFHNRESKGAPKKFTYNMEKYHFEDGKTYEMPLYIMKHLNSLARTVQEGRLSPDGRTPHADIGRKEPRFAVIPVIYDTEIEEAGSEYKSLYTVSYK